MTWHNMMIKRMQCNGKINYRDSGDGKVSTRVDTRQVSKIAKGERRWHEMNTSEKDSFSCHVTTWQGSWHQQDEWKEKILAYMRKISLNTRRTLYSHVWRTWQHMSQNASLECMVHKDKEKEDKWHMWKNCPHFIFVFAKNTFDQHHNVPHALLPQKHVAHDYIWAKMQKL